MVELALFGLLAWGFFQYKTVNIAVRLTLFVVSVLGLLILLKVGFVSTFITTLFSIPVLLVQGVFGLFYHLLVG